LSFAEFSGPPLERFSLMDEDGDGEIDLDAITETLNAARSSKGL